MGTTRLTSRLAHKLLRLFYSLLELLTSLTLSILILPLFTVLYLCNEFIRLIVSILLYYEYLTTGRKQRTRLISNGVDGIWSYQKPGNSRNVLIVYVYNQEIDLATIRQNYSRCIVEKVEYKKLKQIFVKRYSYMCWKESSTSSSSSSSGTRSFDIANHVKYVETSEGTTITETQLKTVILPALAKDMDETKPQWEELIIPTFVYDNDTQGEANAEAPRRRSARIYRSHHAYMDGGSTLMLCANMYTPDAGTDTDADATTTATATKYCTAPTFPYMVNPLAPLKIPAWKSTLYKIKCALLGLTTLVRILVEASQIRSRFLVRGSYSGRQIFNLSPPIKLSTLKEIKEVTHTSLPTILSSVIGTSVQSLEQKMTGDGAGTGAGGGCSLPIGLVGAILPYPDRTPCNRFTVVNFRVSTSSTHGKLENLKDTQKAMSALTTSPNGYINYVLFRIFGKCPAFILQFMMRKAGTSIIYSNTPWAMERVKLWGIGVEDVFGWMPLLTTAGIGILTVSYHDTLKFCVIADDGCVSEKEAKWLTEELSMAVEELVEECRSRKRIRSNGVVVAAAADAAGAGANVPLLV